MFSRGACTVTHQDSRTTFEPFWNLFPRRTCKGAAWQLWDRMSHEDRELALQAVKIYRRVFDAADAENRGYLYSMVRWLRDQCWHDDPGEWWRLAKVQHEVRPANQLMARFDGDKEGDWQTVFFTYTNGRKSGPYRTREEAEAA